MELSILNSLPLAEKTHIITDHKPFLPLFQKSLTNTTPHLSRLLLHVSEYDVQLHYQPSSRMKLSDALSRQSNHSTDAGNKTEINGINISISAQIVRGVGLSPTWCYFFLPYDA